MTTEEYVIDHTGLDWRSLLEEWQWLLPAKFTVWLLTRAGDLFIELPDGSIHMMDVGAGQLRRVADSRDDASTKLRQPEVAKEWLMIPVVDQLVGSGCVLSVGQCYSYKMLPVLGGSYAPDGRAVLPVREHFGGWGSIHRQLLDVPIGSQVRLEVTD
ncbi:MAG: DUF1851 domain-containing protein [Verrucomicrobia bacterium]|nr:DUF1851 domain-containing protein [Verrucomicrobiota bacterium]